MTTCNSSIEHCDLCKKLVLYRVTVANLNVCEECVDKAKYKEYKVINPQDFESFTRTRAWLISFVTYGPAEIVLSDNTQNAVDTYADWCDEHAPGIFMSEEEVQEVVAEFGEELDIMRAGNYGKPINTTSEFCQELDYDMVKSAHMPSVKCPDCNQVVFVGVSDYVRIGSIKQDSWIAELECKCGHEFVCLQDFYPT